MNNNVVATDWERWGPLRARYETERPRRMLSLDGGGIRGILSLQVLKQMETLLADHYHRGDAAAQAGFRLCHFFDYIGGTSTGAIIAAGLARGMSVADIEVFYSDFGKEAFTKRSLFERWKSLYENGPLEAKLKGAFAVNGRLDTLEPRCLKTLLLVVTKNLTTDSAWPISSNPNARYNDPASPQNNLKIPLWQIVRASAAAPVYFPPEVVALDPVNPTKTFVFVDGGTTPYNHPGFVMVRMATTQPYRLQWRMGEEQLLLVSIGTGWSPVAGISAAEPEANLVAAGLTTLSSLMRHAEVDQDTNCRVFGRCQYGHVLDREIGDLIPRRDGKPIPLSENLGRGFVYCRYDAEFTREGLDALKLTSIEPKDVSGMDKVSSMPQLTDIGAALARRVDLSHFGSFIDAPLDVVP